MWLWKGSIAPKRYKVEPRPAASGGAEFLWTIFDAVDTQAESQVGNKCSLFVCDKAALAKKIPDSTAREATLNQLRESVKKIASIRHPNVLRIKELITETRAAVAFIAEPVFLSLANAHKEFVGLENEDITEAMRTFKLSPTDLACGALHITKGLTFLHENGMVHGNISPYTIFICSDGTWKIGDFMFLQKISSSGLMEFECSSLKGTQPYEVVPQYPVSPSLFHCAPEMKHDPFRFNEKADSWSLGAVLFELYSERPLLESGGSAARIKRTLRDWQDLGHTALEPGGTLQRFMGAIPQSLRQILVRMLQPLPSHRPGMKEFLSSPFFEQDGPMKTLQVVESIVEMHDAREQAKSLSSLPQLVERLDEKVQKNIVLPTILQLARNPSLGPFCVPVLLIIARAFTKEEFGSNLAPEFGKLFVVGTKSTPQMSLQLARHTSELMRISDGAFVESNVIPIITHSLDSTAAQINMAILKDLAVAMEELKSRSGMHKVEIVMNSSILPRLKQILSTTQNQPVRVHALMALAGLIAAKNINRDSLSAHVFPALRECLKADRSAATVMCMLGVLESAVHLADASQLGKSILPMTTTLSCESCLNQTQFMTFMEKSEQMLASFKALRERELGSASTSMPISSHASRDVTEIPLPHISHHSSATPISSLPFTSQAPLAPISSPQTQPVAGTSYQGSDLAMFQYEQGKSMNVPLAKMSMPVLAPTSTPLSPTPQYYQPQQQQQQVLSPVRSAQATSVLGGNRMPTFQYPSRSQTNGLSDQYNGKGNGNMNTFSFNSNPSQQANSKSKPDDNFDFFN